MARAACLRIVALAGSLAVAGCYGAGTTVLESKRPAAAGAVSLLVAPPRRPFVGLGTIHAAAVLGSSDVDHMLEDVRRQGEQLGADAVVIDVGSAGNCTSVGDNCWTLDGTAIRYAKP